MPPSREEEPGNARPEAVAGGARGEAGVLHRQVRVGSPQGLHARPAARVVDVARAHRAEVRLFHGDTRANAKDLLDLLYLAAPHGTELRLETEGEDAAAALEAMVALFEALGAEG